MSKDVQIKIKGVNALMRSPGVQKLITHEAQKIRAKAGKGFAVRDRPHKWVARSYVYTANRDAAKAQADHYVLQKAVGRS